MNRPFGSGENSPVRIETSLTLAYLADVSANIKGVVSKAMTQKILTAAAERGEITQKTYGPSSQGHMGLGTDVSNRESDLFCREAGRFNFNA